MKNLAQLLSTGSASSRHLALFPVLETLVLMTCLWVYLLYYSSRFFCVCIYTYPVTMWSQLGTV
jgi:ABC-type siderophore export system fused ATPase/permease subunit